MIGVVMEVMVVRSSFPYLSELYRLENLSLIPPWGKSLRVQVRESDRGGKVLTYTG